MDTTRVDTSYQSFSVCLNDLKNQLDTLHDAIHSTDDHPMRDVIVKQVVQVIRHVGCLMKGLSSGHVDYTQDHAIVLNVKDKHLLVRAYQKTMINVVNAIDDYHLEKLHSPLWVCRCKTSNGREFWSLSNLSNELSVLMAMLSQTVSLLEALPVNLEA